MTDETIPKELSDYTIEELQQEILSRPQRDIDSTIDALYDYDNSHFVDYVIDYIDPATLLDNVRDRMDHEDILSALDWSDINLSVVIHNYIGWDYTRDYVLDNYTQAELVELATMTGVCDLITNDYYEFEQLFIKLADDYYDAFQEVYHKVPYTHNKIRHLLNVNISDRKYFMSAVKSIPRVIYQKEDKDD